MGVNKEREDFEAEFSKIKSDIAFWLHTWDEEMQGYNHPVMCWFWYMWQAAKAQAVPEGFVLASKEPSADLVNHGHQVFLGHFNEGGQTGGRSLYFAYKAMIKAQEPTND